MADFRDFVHQRDVEVTLGVLDNLGGFGDLDRRRAVDARLDDRAVEVGERGSVCASWPATTLVIFSIGCSLSPGLMRSGL